MSQIKLGRVVLVAGCESAASAHLEGMIRSLGYAMELARDGDTVRSFLETSGRRVAGVIVNALVRDRSAFDVVREVREMHPDMPLLILACRPSTDDIIAGMKSGATEFLFQPIEHESTARILARALESQDVEREPAPRSGDGSGFFVGRNALMREIQGLAGRIGRSGVPVLIQGETGSGKEVLARELHNRSSRARRPFLKLNCAALPSELVESELFGYERGAFTGAFQRKAGMFELADSGTLMLDEIGDMDVRLQAKLLQVLQDREFRRIGGKEIVKVDVRIIAATHRDLEQAIQERTFREDLYYRLNVVNLVVPPLRERRDDIIPIAEFLIRKHAQKNGPIPNISVDLERAMMAYHWPGNVRELENSVQQLIIFEDCGSLAREIHSKATRRQAASARTSENHPSPAERSRSVSALQEATKAKEAAETDAIMDALNSTRWNRKRAAAILHIDYKSLLYKMKKLGIEDRPMLLPERLVEVPQQKVRAANGTPPPIEPATYEINMLRHR